MSATNILLEEIRVRLDILTNAVRDSNNQDAVCRGLDQLVREVRKLNEEFNSTKNYSLAATIISELRSIRSSINLLQR